MHLFIILKLTVSNIYPADEIIASCVENISGGGAGSDVVVKATCLESWRSRVHPLLGIQNSKEKEVSPLTREDSIF